jgi:para-nitrobenzyl esterase
MGGAAALAGSTAAIAVGCGKSTSETMAAAACDTTIVASDSNAVVDTTAGKVWGFTRNGIQTFKGIPYAASTQGKARYLPPAKPKPWTEKRSAMWYGKTCPQTPGRVGITISTRFSPNGTTGSRVRIACA